MRIFNVLLKIIDEIINNITQAGMSVSGIFMCHIIN